VQRRYISAFPLHQIRPPVSFTTGQYNGQSNEITPEDLLHIARSISFKDILPIPLLDTMYRGGAATGTADYCSMQSSPTPTCVCVRVGLPVSANSWHSADAIIDSPDVPEIAYMHPHASPVQGDPNFTLSSARNPDLPSVLPLQGCQARPFPRFSKWNLFKKLRDQDRPGHQVCQRQVERKPGKDALCSPCKRAATRRLNSNYVMISVHSYSLTRYICDNGQPDTVE